MTVATRVIAGPGHAPLALFSLWKEALLLAILVIALVELFRSVRTIKRPDALDLCIVGLVIVAWLVSSFIAPAEFRAIVYGIRYDFVPLIAFLLLRRVPWSPEFLPRATRVLLGIGAIAAGYGILSFILPPAFFVQLGYSDQHSLYIPSGPVAAFQLIGGSAIRRVQGSFSGPNQFGLWLLLPWSIVVMALAKKADGRRQMADVSASKTLSANHCSPVAAPLLVSLLLILGCALLLTFSRSAWLGAAIVCVAALVFSVPPRLRRASLVTLAGCGAACIALLILLAPATLLRLTSNRGHIERPMQAIQLIQFNPLGFGLGAAGPASNRLHEPCVYLEPGSDPSWAKVSPDLCVFVDDEQVQPPLPSGELRPASQPAGRECDCPFLPENWYLQMGVELGAAGLILFVLLTVFTVRRLLRASKKEITPAPVFAAFLAIAVAALVLHAWEDSAVAYTLWLLVAVVLPRRRF